MKIIAKIERLAGRVERNNLPDQAGLYSSLWDRKLLKSLTLVGTAVADAGLKELREIGNLSTLDLRSAKVTSEGCKDLKKALPNALIISQQGCIIQ